MLGQKSTMSFWKVSKKNFPIYGLIKKKIKNCGQKVLFMNLAERILFIRHIFLVTHWVNIVVVNKRKLPGPANPGHPCTETRKGQSSEGGIE